MSARPGPARSALAGHAALIAVQLCFGLLPLFGKLAFRAFEPGAVAGYRIACGAVAFALVAFAVHGRAMWPGLRDLALLQLCAVLGVAANQWLYLEGLQRSTVVNAGLMMMLIPVFTFALAVAVRQERFAWPRLAGIAIALAGTLQLLLAREPDLSRPYLIGNLLMVANTLSFSLFLIASKPLTRRLPPLVLLAWIFVLSAWTLPLLARDADLVPAAADGPAWASLGAVLVVSTAFGYLLNLVALARLPASTTAVYVFSQPLIAGLSGVVWLGEPLREGTVLAAVCIFIGIWLVAVRRRA